MTTDEPTINRDNVLISDTLSSNKVPTPTMMMTETSKHTDTQQKESNETLDTIKGIISSFTTTINGTLQEWQQLRQSDTETMTQMAKRIQQMENDINITNDNMKQIEVNMATTVDTTVKTELDTHMRAFDRKLTHHVRSAIQEITEYNKQQANDTKSDQDRFMTECRNMQAESKQLFSVLLAHVSGNNSPPFSTTTNLPSASTKQNLGTLDMGDGNKRGQRTPVTRSSTKTMSNGIVGISTNYTATGHLGDENMSSPNNEDE
jgi:hypothetical protein